MTLAKSREDFQLPGTTPAVLVLAFSTWSQEVRSVQAWVVHGAFWWGGSFEAVVICAFGAFWMKFLKAGGVYIYINKYIYINMYVCVLCVFNDVHKGDL